MSEIVNIVARQIFDSRGYPTVEVDVFLEDGSFGRASVPSGASKGAYEAYELRDKRKSFYLGKSVFNSINLINTEIFDLLSGLNALEQRKIDISLCELDGTKNKSRLGANSLLGVSLAVAKAASKSKKLCLWQYIGGINSYVLPIPLINIINGGAHANNNLNFQEFMIVPVGVNSFKDALKISMEVFHTLKEILRKDGFSISVGDEGGFSPDLKNEEEAIIYIDKAIQKAGYNCGKDFFIAIDAAANEFYDDKLYSLKSYNKQFTTEQLKSLWENLINKYPIFSIEDPFSEDDWEGFVDLTNSVGSNIQIVGDDLFVTNKDRLKIGINKNAGNSILIKPNQIGTLTETIDTINLAKNNGYEIIISHRSGDTEDDFISDLSVAMNSSQIKTGSLSRSERLSKYNQLLRIEEELGNAAEYKGHDFYKKYKNL